MAQTAMMGMQPGAGNMPGGMPGPGAAMSMPGQSMGGNAMALSHLTPQASLMQQQQMQQASKWSLYVANLCLVLTKSRADT